jgi:hypothetical protein
MREMIAVNHFFAAWNMQILKREALMFDRMAVPHLSELMSFGQILIGQYLPQATEYEWLCDQGLLFEAPYEKSANIQTDEYQEIEIAGLEYAKKLETLVKEHELEEITEIEKDDFMGSVEKLKVSLANKVSNLTALVTSEEFQRSVVLAYDFVTRGISIQLRELKGLDAYPIVLMDIPTAKQKQMTTLNDVVEITLKELPIPDENTPWEDIMYFRSDEKSRSKFLALKDWMNEVVRMELRPYEVEDKLRSLLDEYKQHMEAYKIKTKLDTLKTIAIAEAGFITSGWLTGLGAIPGLVGMVVNPLYSIKQRNAALLQEELKAPGNQVAYIVKAQEEFKR